MDDAADHTAIVHPVLAANVCRQMRLDLSPLIIAQPEKIAPHRLHSRITTAENQHPIHPAMDLLSFDPSYTKSG
jgi:hypothetical protein